MTFQDLQSARRYAAMHIKDNPALEVVITYSVIDRLFYVHMMYPK